MDPELNRQLQLSIAREALYGEGEPDVEQLLVLCDLVLSLDEWLRKGGAFPAAWMRRR